MPRRSSSPICERSLDLTLIGIGRRDIPQCNSKHFHMEAFYQTFSGGQRPSFTPPLLAGYQTVSFKSWQAVTSPAFLKTLFPFAFHAKIIRDGKHAAYRIGVNPGLILVALSGNYPLERHLAVIYYDVNRWNGLHGITVEARLAENGAIRGDADSIVHRRERQNLDLIIDACHAFNTLHHVFSIALERRPRHLAVQTDGAAVHAVGQIVEYSVVRQHDQLDRKST